MSELGQSGADRIEEVLDRISRVVETLSERSRAVSDTVREIIPNLKDGGRLDAGARGTDAGMGESFDASAERLGEVMDRMSQIMDTLSETLKTVSETARGTTQNTKYSAPADDGAGGGDASTGELFDAGVEQLDGVLDRFSLIVDTVSERLRAISDTARDLAPDTKDGGAPDHSASGNDPVMGEMQVEMDWLVEHMRGESEMYDRLSELLADSHDTVTQSTPNIKDGGPTEAVGPGELIESMGLEDYLVYIFMLIAEDSRTDMRDLLSEMDEARRERDGVRDGGAPAPIPPVETLTGATSLAAGASTSAGAASLLPWAALVVVGGIAGGVLGASGALGRPTTEAPAVEVAVAQTTPGYDCPGGAVVASFLPNQRVLARERSEDSAWLAVRDPLHGLRTVWVLAGVVDIDEGEAGIDSLAVGGCPETIVVLTAPEEIPAPTEPAPGTPVEPGVPGQPGPPPAPAPPPPPPPPADTTPPSISSVSLSPTQIYQTETTVVTVSASDNTAVTGVSISWSGAQQGSAEMSPSGSQWRYTFTAANTPSGTITFRVQARDAAGNTSAPAQVNLNYIQFI